MVSQGAWRGAPPGLQLYVRHIISTWEAGVLDGRPGGGSDWDWLSQDCPTRHARGHAEKTAVVELATGRELTYRELDLEVGRCAAWLREGVSPGARVAVLGRNCLQQVI